MSALPSPASVPNPLSRRAFKRYPLDARLDVITLRSGIPDSLPGRCTDLSEEGIGAVIAGELAIGQQVGIELKLPHVNVPLQARALVRHDEELHFGLQLLKLTPEQREMIRYWAYRSSAEQTVTMEETAGPVHAPQDALSQAPVHESKPKKRIRIRRRRFFMLVAVILSLVLLAWWRWQKAWEELEKPIAVAVSQPAAEQGDSARSPQVATVEPSRIPGRP